MSLPPLHTSITGKLALLAAVVLGCSSNLVLADNEQRGDRDASYNLSFPADGELISLTIDAPEEVRLGETYKLKVMVANNSDNVMLRNVKLKASSNGPVEIQSSSVNGEQKSKDDSSSKSDENSSKDGQSSDAENQDNQSNNSKQNFEIKRGDGNSWTISKLAPGESKQIILEAVGDKQKEAHCCFSLVSYSQSICVATKFIKPELSITKSAPENISLCDVVAFTYTVKNDGTGDVGAFVVEDKLPEGLETESGDKHLKFTVGELKAGDTRKFEADIRATKRGDFSSRAIAKAKNSDLKNQSNKTTTKVKGPELAVAIDGPATAYVDRPADYTVRITNVGNEAVDDGLLELSFPTSVEMTDEEAFEPTDNKVSASNSNSDKSQQPKEAGDDEASSKNDEKSSDEEVKGNENLDYREIEFAELEPGETVMLRFSLQGMDDEKLNIRAKALYRCEMADGKESVTSSTASTQTKVVSLPALLVTVVDEQDPVRVGDEVMYTITVRNQGTAADKDVQVTAELPESLSFSEAGGETSAKNDGQQVKFEKVKTIEPGEDLQWTLKATAKSKANTKLRVTLKSKGLKQKVESQEPTQLYGSNGQDSEDSSESI